MSDTAGGARVGDRSVAVVLSEFLLEEFEPEIGACRRTLERVPEDRLGWRPHPKSAEMGWLAGHLANVPSWAGMTIRTESLDIAPDGEEAPPLLAPESVAEVVQAFDRNAEDARSAIRGAANDELLLPWSLLRNGRVLLTQTRLSVLRTFVFNHLVHHRAQLGVYLRLNDVSVPAIYGPSADEDPFGS